jgi:hypothetical protein
MLSQERGTIVTPTVQNLNSKLSPRPRRESPRVAAAKRHLAAPSSAPPIRTTAGRNPDRGGGHCINV